MKSSDPIIPLRMVRMTGFEPAAPCSQSRCATKLRHIRINQNILYYALPKSSMIYFNASSGGGVQYLLTSKTCFQFNSGLGNSDMLPLK